MRQSISLHELNFSSFLRGGVQATIATD